MKKSENRNKNDLYGVKMSIKNNKNSAINLEAVRLIFPLDSQTLCTYNL